MIVTARDVWNELCVPFGLTNATKLWFAARPKDIRDWIGSHPWTCPSVAEVEEVLRYSGSALGNIQKAEVIPAIIAAPAPPWAAQFIFHRLWETLGYVPSWKQYWQVVSVDRAGGWYESLMDAGEGHGGYKIHRSIQWRVALFWQSAMREQHLLATLNERFGLVPRYHPIADCFLRIDGWIPGTLFLLHVPSNFQPVKQKPPPLPYGWRSIEVPIAHQGKGRVWLADYERLARSLERIPA